jgi:hypothetical protein
MSTFMKPFAVRAGEGVQLSAPTNRSVVVVMADTLQTGGSLSVLELQIHPYRTPSRTSVRRWGGCW